MAFFVSSNLTVSRHVKLRSEYVSYKVLAFHLTSFEMQLED
jgi:hypothetical protein